MKAKNTIKVYLVTESDWIAASSAREARAELKRFFGGDVEPLERVRALSVEELKALDFVNLETGKKLGSFYAILNRQIRRGYKFPRMFATSEW